MYKYIGAIEAVLELKRVDGGIERFPTVIELTKELTPVEAIKEVVTDKRFLIAAGVVAAGVVTYVGYKAYKKHKDNEEAQDIQDDESTDEVKEVEKDHTTE